MKNDRRDLPPPITASLVTRLRVATTANRPAKNIFKALHFSMKKKTQTSFSSISIIADILEINEMRHHRYVYCKNFLEKNNGGFSFGNLHF